VSLHDHLQQRRIIVRGNLLQVLKVVTPGSKLLHSSQNEGFPHCGNSLQELSFAASGGSFCGTQLGDNPLRSMAHLCHSFFDRIGQTLASLGPVSLEHLAADSALCTIYDTQKPHRLTGVLIVLNRC
jgi:hypothetical protein